MNIIRTDKPLTDEERAKVLFRGDVLIQTNIHAMHQLIQWTQSLLNDALAPLEPTTAQSQLSPRAFIKSTSAAQAVFHTNEHAKTLFFNALLTCGVNPDNTYYDHFPLRIVPYGHTHHGARNSFISPHRDTWGSNIHSQVNWWAPIYTLAASRTIALYPAYWTKPLSNNTADWRFEKHMESRRNTPAGQQAPYPSAPIPLTPIDETGVVNVMLAPGDILSFSSAHLHGSVPNTSERTRYSVEMRTINQIDLATGNAAPNVDNAGIKQMTQWFKRISDKHPLHAAIC